MDGKDCSEITLTQKKQIRLALHFQKVIIIALDKNLLFNWSQDQIMQKVYKLAVKFSYFTALKGAIVCHEAGVDPHRFSPFKGNWSEFHNRYILI